jgi:hypothetical protein
MEDFITIIYEPTLYAIVTLFSALLSRIKKLFGKTAPPERAMTNVTPARKRLPK